MDIFEFDWLDYKWHDRIEAQPKRAILIIFETQNMAEFEAQIDCIQTEMENFLKAQARSLPIPSHPIFLKSEYKNNLRLIDSQGRQFQVDESFLSAFRDVYTDKNFKAVKLNSWEFELSFVGKVCSRIVLMSDKVTFLSSKNNKRELVGCHFKILIAEEEEINAKVGDQMLGYLNRIGKKKVSEVSYNKASEMKSLISFATHQQKKIPSFKYNPHVKATPRVQDPMTTLAPEGKRVLEKLRHFVKREDIANYATDNEVSSETAESLKRLIAKGK